MTPADSNDYGMPASRPEDYAAARLDVIRARWDQKADRWDSDLADPACHLHEDGAYRRLLEVADREIAGRADFCRRHVLVDLGCGTGLVLAEFADRFAGGLGIDISPRMLDVARRRNLPRCEFRTADCFALAGEIRHAGAVLSRGILLSHYGRERAPRLLEQVRLTLAPGGFALLDFLNVAARERFPANPENKTYYISAEIESCAQQAGFARTRILGEAERRVLIIVAET